MQMCKKNFALHIVVQMLWMSAPWVIDNLCKPVRFWSLNVNTFLKVKFWDVFRIMKAEKVVLGNHNLHV